MKYIKLGIIVGIVLLSIYKVADSEQKASIAGEQDPAIKNTLKQN